MIEFLFCFGRAGPAAYPNPPSSSPPTSLNTTTTHYQPFGSLLGIGVLAEEIGGLYPMGGVVADALLVAPLLRRAVNWLGVRRACSENIVQMFVDGFKVY